MKKSHRYKNILETKKMVKNILKVLYNLNNYLWLHGCLSFRTTYVHTWVRHTLGISASSQNVTNESFLLCVKSEKYAFWVTLRHLGYMPQGKAKLSTLHYWARWSGAAYIRTHFSFSSPPQCWSQAVVCVSTPRMYPQSRYFLVNV